MKLLKLKNLFLLALVIGALAVLWQLGVFPTGESRDYQAVFLTNNQVYFGKLYNTRSAFPVLKDIYYLQVTQSLQPKDPTAPVQPQINLVKLGNELHGPKDEMKINRDQILFFEDLKETSAVVAAIREYQKNQ
jgi:hypothetical protein